MYEERKFTFVGLGSATVRYDSPPLRLLESSFGRTALETQVIEEFWTRYLPRDSPNTVHVGGILACPWKKTIQDLSMSDESVALAVRACAFTSLGQLDENSHYVKRGQELYIKCLRGTNKALQNPTQARGDAVLATCKVLGLYENFRNEAGSVPSSQGTDWQRHIQGTCRIVELRGPDKHVSSYGHELFGDARVNAVFGGAARRKPIFPRELAWKTVPWASNPRNLRDELFDDLITLPEILQDQDQWFDTIKTVGEQADGNGLHIFKAGQDLLNQFMMLSHRLHAWEQKTISLCSQTEAQSWSQASATTASPQLPKTLLEVCKMHGYGFFQLISQYWGGCVVLYGATWLTYRTVNELSTKMKLAKSESLLPTMPPWLNPEPVAANIAHCCSHFYQSDAGLWGSQGSTVSMTTAFHYFAAVGKVDCPEMQELRSALGSSRKGSMASQFMRSLAADGETFTPKRDTFSRDEHREMALDWFNGKKVSQRSEPTAMNP